jgi:hypothetical protein
VEVLGLNPMGLPILAYGYNKYSNYAKIGRQFTIVLARSAIFSERPLEWWNFYL